MLNIKGAFQALDFDNFRTNHEHEVMTLIVQLHAYAGNYCRPVVTDTPLMSPCVLVLRPVLPRQML